MHQGNHQNVLSKVARNWAGCAAAALLLWSYWPVFTDLEHAWSALPQYSHGFLVPLVSLVLLWQSRSAWAGFVARPTWFAVPVLLMALAMRLVGAYYYSPWLEQISLLPALAAVCLALGGWTALRLTAPAIAFLVFMLPLPGRLDKALAGPLQQLATLVSTNILQTLGFFAQAEGNVIVLKDYDLGIVEACSGLRMLMTFIAAATAVAILLPRSPVQRAIIVASAVPIALLCNIIRIVVTGVLHETVGHEAANFVYHDVAGWLMSPLALVFLGLELLLLRHLFLPVGDAALGTRPAAAPVPKPVPQA
jgi:exosortase